MIYKIKGINCASCASLIEMDLEDMGIKCKCSYIKETLELEKTTDFIKAQEILKKSGYNLMQ